MNISHHFATENALLKPVTLFLSICSVFTLIVLGVSWGRYGYGPSIDFYWAPVTLLIFWNWKSTITTSNGSGFLYKVRWLGITIKEEKFEKVRWQQNGKLRTLYGSTKHSEAKTMFCIEKGVPKQLLIEKLINTPTFS